MTNRELENELDRLWVLHTAIGDNEWDNWRRFGRAVAQAERDHVLAMCALEGMTIKDIIRITQDRSKA